MRFHLKRAFLIYVSYWNLWSICLKCNQDVVWFSKSRNRLITTKKHPKNWPKNLTVYPPSDFTVNWPKFLQRLDQIKDGSLRGRRLVQASSKSSKMLHLKLAGRVLSDFTSWHLATTKRPSSIWHISFHSVRSRWTNWIRISSKAWAIRFYMRSLWKRPQKYYFKHYFISKTMGQLANSLFGTRTKRRNSS